MLSYLANPYALLMIVASSLEEALCADFRKGQPQFSCIEILESRALRALPGYLCILKDEHYCVYDKGRKETLHFLNNFNILKLSRLGLDDTRSSEVTTSATFRLRDDVLTGADGTSLVLIIGLFGGVLARMMRRGYLS